MNENARDLGAIAAAVVLALGAVCLSLMIGCATNCRTVTKCYPREGALPICIDHQVCD